MPSIGVSSQHTASELGGSIDDQEEGFSLVELGWN